MKGGRVGARGRASRVETASLFAVDRSPREGVARGSRGVVVASGGRASDATHSRVAGVSRQAGFKEIRLRGDTDFSLTTEFDRWDDDGVRFVFGYDARANLIERAQSTDNETYHELVTRAERQIATTARTPPPQRQGRHRARAQLQPATSTTGQTGRRTSDPEQRSDRVTRRPPTPTARRIAIPTVPQHPHSRAEASPGRPGP
jgi:hypothetical protein